MDEEQSKPQNAEDETEAATGASGEGQGDGKKSAEQAEKESEEAKETVRALEEDPPEKLEDWPDDKAKYETFGGAEGNESYEESVTSKLGPSSLRHREDGSVEVEGEAVENPEEYKGDPIPGGPTDPKMEDSRAYGEPDLTDESSQGGGGADESAESAESSSSSSDDEGDSSGGGGGG